jgi:hypothetical protein
MIQTPGSGAGARTNPIRLLSHQKKITIRVFLVGRAAFADVQLQPRKSDVHPFLPILSTQPDSRINKDTSTNWVFSFQPVLKRMFDLVPDPLPIPRLWTRSMQVSFPFGEHDGLTIHASLPVPRCFVHPEQRQVTLYGVYARNINTPKKRVVCRSMHYRKVQKSSHFIQYNPSLSTFQRTKV